MKTKSILIAEDDREIAHFIVATFERLGFKVIKSHDGRKTISAARKHLPDVILLDILMPKINGVEVIHNLRESDSPCRKTPIIVLSALDRLYQKREALEAGADVYLCKPMFTEDIVSEVLKWVDDR
ncbi:MAG: response regulator [Desulfobacteraceae bacterium]|jgi:two-component system alkaline phosphatase synthesis response regulator PhoP